MLFHDVVRRWRELMRRGAQRTPITGIYGLPRGGTNFIAAALHYHPQLFSVNEHVFDYRLPLRSIWRRGSIFRIDGRQDKQISRIRSVVFNKMQEFFPELWNPRCQFPAESRFIFYLRNPVRVHLSREEFRRRHKPGRTEWADTRQNFQGLLAETAEIMEAFEILKPRHPCFALAHEHFCLCHEAVLPQLHAFLGVDPIPERDPRAFLRTCGRCGRELVVVESEQQLWLACPRHRQPVSGCGRFNPLRPIDRRGILDDSWKTAPHIDQMMADFRRHLGTGLADYFWSRDYTRNMPLEVVSPTVAARAAAA